MSKLMQKVCLGSMGMARRKTLCCVNTTRTKDIYIRVDPSAKHHIEGTAETLLILLCAKVSRNQPTALVMFDTKRNTA
jgi:hypothetical protein